MSPTAQAVQAQMPTLPAVGVFAPQKGNVDYFVYPFNQASLTFAAGANGPTATLTQQLSADSDFYWTATSYQVDLATAAQTNASRVVPAVTIQIIDQGANRSLHNAPVPLATVAGFGNEPHRLVHPRLFTRATSITVVLFNYSTVENYTNVYVVLEGFKVYSL
jgi:hypothetical protein